jgi:hypothetical protein
MCRRFVAAFDNLPSELRVALYGATRHVTSRMYPAAVKDLEKAGDTFLEPVFVPLCRGEIGKSDV